MHPLISIIIPVFNGEKWLEEAILSCFKSTYNNIDVIIVNDGSTDSSLNIAEKLKNEVYGKIRIYSQKNRGACSARNKGLHEANGEYVLFLDADDVLYPGSIEKLIHIIGKNNDFVYGDALIINEKSESIGKRVQKPTSTDAIASIIRCCPFSPTVLYRRSSILLHKWNEVLPCCQEFDFTSRLVIGGANSFYEPTPVALVREHQSPQRISINNARNNFDVTLAECFDRFECLLIEKCELNEERRAVIHSGFLMVGTRIYLGGNKRIGKIYFLK